QAIRNRVCTTHRDAFRMRRKGARGSKGMHFDQTLWRMTRGQRGRIAAAVVLGLLALTFGIARFAFLGRFLAGVFRGKPATDLAWPLAGAGIAIVLRAALD